jgi:nucleoid-associated protein YgaU
MMATAGAVTKAVIKNLATGKEVKVLFNPKEYAFSKANQWKAGDGKGGNVSPLEFGTGGPTTLTLQLFFDTFEQRRDVRDAYTNALWQLTLVDKKLKDKKNKKGRPPTVQFIWGNAWFFKAVITNIKQNFTMFLDDGTPVRATVDITFQQVEDTEDFKKQNPTSAGTGGQRVWTVHQGDTLASIAYEEYGDATLWRPIADANRLENVRRLTPGAVLEIPDV